MKKLILNGEEISVENFKKDGDSISFSVDGSEYHWQQEIDIDPYKYFFRRGEKNFSLTYFGGQGVIGGKDFYIDEKNQARSSGELQDDSGLTSPMPGKVLNIKVTKGQRVSKGDVLLVMEAMKMEHTIYAPNDGKVAALHFSEGDLVEGGAQLLEIV